MSPATQRRLTPAVIEKRNELLALELDCRTWRRAERTAQARYRASRTDENLTLVMAIRAVISMYENGGAC